MIKNFIQKIKHQALITLICLIKINLLFASPEEIEPLQDNSKSVAQLIEQRNDLIDEAARLNGNGLLLPSNMRQARQTHTSLSESLNKNRIMWYTSFAGMGAGLAISNAFEVTEIGTYTYYMLGGLAAGLITGGAACCFINRTFEGGEKCIQNPCTNITSALLSFVPWIIFGATKPKSHP